MEFQDTEKGKQVGFVSKTSQPPKQRATAGLCQQTSKKIWRGQEGGLMGDN